MRNSFWPDHVSFQTLEKMCLCLIEGQDNQHKLTCYRVCVYMKAATMLCRLPKKDRSEPLRRHLEQSKKQYEREVYKALSEIDYLAPPSLFLLQAFLSGVCWTCRSPVRQSASHADSLTTRHCSCRTKVICPEAGHWRLSHLELWYLSIITRLILSR